MNGFTAAISGVSGAIGRYFSIVSFIPSLLLASFTFALIQSGAWTGDGGPSWSRAGEAFTHLGTLALLVLISVVLGIALHPLQFSLVQFFEGYWGAGRFAQRLRIARIRHHRHRLAGFRDGRGAKAGVALGQEADPEKRVELMSWRDEAARLEGGYPVLDHEDAVMPTRLGNVLRRYERLAGYQYQLDAIQVIRHIAFVAPAEHVEYLNDQRELLDLSVRMCVTSIIAVLVSIAFLWHHGLWLTVALVPYAVAYLSYRGAVIVAHEYGAAICTLIDLDRFALYDALRLPRPKNTASERLTNASLTELLDHKLKVSLRYVYREDANGVGNQTGAT
jgi:hypothetical protein